jgi:hypothetical protein
MFWTETLVQISAVNSTAMSVVRTHGVRTYLDPYQFILKYLIAMMLEAANTCETSLNFYQATRRYNPQHSQPFS